MRKFLRRNSDRHSKLGRKRKKKQIWRKPKGRHNKMREKRRGYPIIVKIGYKGSKNKKEKFYERNPVLIRNLKDLEKIKGNEMGMLGNVGKKKKIEIAQKARERKIKICNLNTEKFLEKNQIKNKKEKQETQK